MHDNENMAAPQCTKITPIRNHDLHNSLTHKPYGVLSNTHGFTEIVNSYSYSNDDDISDHDSHYSEDLLDDNFLEQDSVLRKPPDLTQRLLNFAEMVNSDIQNFFGRKKGDEDSCDIYENKWTCRKSGREQYYADLLRVAQGDNIDHTRSIKVSSSLKPKVDNRGTFSGKLDQNLGLGPLNELFEYGLRHFLADSKFKSKKLKRLKHELKKYNDLVPMHQRKLPESFWMEPGIKDKNVNGINGSSTVLLNSTNPPDFSDLLQSWTGEMIHFNGDISSSDVSMASPESDTEHM